MQKIPEASLRILHALGAILFFYWIGGCLLFGQQSQIPPDVLMISNLNCRIEQRGKHWIARGVVSYLEHTNYAHALWETPPFPERKSNSASLKDCNAWFAAVKKVQAVTKPVDVNDLKERK